MVVAEDVSDDYCNFIDFCDTIKYSFYSFTVTSGVPLWYKCCFFLRYFNNPLSGVQAWIVPLLKLTNKVIYINQKEEI